MAVIGTLSIGALYLIGIPRALFLGVFTELVCFIPLIGPINLAVPPLVLSR
jgi:predicted PurR-regulated permease PerM